MNLTVRARQTAGEMKKKKGVRGFPVDMSDNYVKLQASTPDRSGGDRRRLIDRGGNLEEEAWESVNNYTGVEIVQKDGRNTRTENFKRNKKLSSMGGSRRDPKGEKGFVVKIYGLDI